MGNKISLAGRIESEINVFKSTEKETLVEFFVASKRNSGVEDVLRVVAHEKLVSGVKKDDEVCIFGEVRTRNEDEHLKIFVFAKEILFYKGEDLDVAEISGFICSKKKLRKTLLSNQTILEFVLANNDRGGSSYIPCILWNGSAKAFKDIKIGTEVKVSGRLQSRNYVKVLDENKTEIRTAYELSVFWIEEVEGKL